MWLLQPVMCSRVLRVRGQAEDSSLQDRGQWASKAEFLLAVAGQIIGLGNVWRFPYLCYKNGGGVFFVPYMLFLLVCGVPLFLLETALGQFTSLGGVGAWMKICPLFVGLGFASQMMILHSCVYYIVILAWAFFYLCSSFQTRLPWSHCNNTWNTDPANHGANTAVQQSHPAGAAPETYFLCSYYKRVSVGRAKEAVM